MRQIYGRIREIYITKCLIFITIGHYEEKYILSDVRVHCRCPPRHFLVLG